MVEYKVISIIFICADAVQCVDRKDQHWWTLWTSIVLKGYYSYTTLVSSWLGSISGTASVVHQAIPTTVIFKQ